MYSSSESQQSGSSFNTNRKKRSNVYLSFCGKGESSFASNLYSALSEIPGVRVFCDEYRLRAGRDCTLTPSELIAIGKSQLAIIVFSRNYTNSISCLEELEKIMECCRTTGLILLPLFCNSIRKGMFGEVFQDFVPRLTPPEQEEQIPHSKKKDKFMNWVAAISKYPGYAVNNDR